MQALHGQLHSEHEEGRESWRLVPQAPNHPQYQDASLTNFLASFDGQFFLNDGLTVGPQLPSIPPPPPPPPPLTSPIELVRRVQRRRRRGQRIQQRHNPPARGRRGLTVVQDNVVHDEMLRDHDYTSHAGPFNTNSVPGLNSRRSFNIGALLIFNIKE